MEEVEEKRLAFHEMGLDDRIQKAIAKLGWSSPTLIQERAIPLVLEGKDLLARGRTGSGKTGAFAIPVIQKVLDSKKSASVQSVVALLMAPSRELSRQIHEAIKSLSSSCGRALRSIDLSASTDVGDHRSLLKGDLPDVVVGTPSRILAHLKAGILDLSGLQILVIDEADLVFSFGHERDLKEILSGWLRDQTYFQAILTSATLSEDVGKLKRLVLSNPVTLKLEEPSLPCSNQLVQYQIKVEQEDKYVLIYALFKLKLVQGKSIVFVNTVDKCYQVKLFLEQFGIPACVLNSELPAATRFHIVSQFNKGLYDIIVASDEKFLEDFQGSNLREEKSRVENVTIGVEKGSNLKTGEEEGSDLKKGEEEGSDLKTEEEGLKGKKSREEKKGRKVDVDKRNSKRDKDKESGVARGIDFQFVSNVINFEFPLDTDSYIHRVGRTARGNNKGTALSLVAMKEVDRMMRVESELKKQLGEEKDGVFKPYNFCMQELEGFKYRAKDALRGVTKIAIREARLKEIRAEMINSDKLKAHFSDNPKDAQVLRHDKALHTVKHKPHMKNVPDYIVPKSLKNLTSTKKGGRKTGKKNHNNKSATKRKFDKQHSDPLLALVKRRKK